MLNFFLFKDGEFVYVYNAAYEIQVLIMYPNLNFDQIERTHKLSLISGKNTISFEPVIAKFPSHLLFLDELKYGLNNEII